MDYLERGKIKSLEVEELTGDDIEGMRKTFNLFDTDDMGLLI